ncbi:MAG: hypothetical protein AAFV54_11155 [Pseudomonadota bacterium]
MLRRGWLHFVCLVFIATAVMAWPERHKIPYQTTPDIKTELRTLKVREDLAKHTPVSIERVGNDQHRANRRPQKSIDLKNTLDSYQDILNLKPRRPFKVWSSNMKALFPDALLVCSLFVMAVRKGLRDFFAGWIRSPYYLVDGASFVAQAVVLVAI